MYLKTFWTLFVKTVLEILEAKANCFNFLHCKPKPCIAQRELPVSQFPQGKTCFHYREPLFSLQGPCFHYRDFPVNPCTSLLGIAVQYEKNVLHKFCFSKKNTHPTHTKYEYLLLINHTEKQCIVEIQKFGKMKRQNLYSKNLNDRGVSNMKIITAEKNNQQYVVNSEVQKNKTPKHICF